ncbi:hypothetical protein V6R21_23470 [Limibacter armeniacum]|uniref:hypothetical protein n=1 Tax=Limibacter armeniacum TaxID=466084 RepID=UPI002FE5AE9A
MKYFADKFGTDKFKIKDHWDADLHSIGLTDFSEKNLIYFSSYGKTDNVFYVALENPPQDNNGHPYTPAGDFDQVDLKGLEDLFIRHLRIKT